MVIKCFESFAYFSIDNTLMVYMTEEFGFSDTMAGAWTGMS
jgi:dipeptide/tripeptide permease